jgi:hypothetical protein
MTPEETRQLFKVYDQAAYLVWMGHTNIDGERIVLPYCIPLQQFDRQVVIRTSANPDHLYSDSLSNNARRVYNKPEQEEFIQTLEQYVGQYIYLNLFQRKEEGATYSAEQMQLANIKTTLVLEPPFNLDNPPSQAAAGNFGLSRYRMLEDKLEQIEAKSPIDLPIIKKGDDQIDSEIQPPLVFAFYVFSPNNN